MCLILALCGFFFSGFTSSESLDKYVSWRHLGSKVVDFKVDKDHFLVGPSKGRFEKLKIEVKTGSLNMHKMVVTYGDGSRGDIPLRHNFARGSSSRVIDLPGGKRIVKKITFIYDTKHHSNHKAIVEVFGER